MKVPEFSAQEGLSLKNVSFAANIKQLYDGK